MGDPLLRLGLAALLFVAGAFGAAVYGLALFRRDYARRLVLLGAVPDVELAFGEPWLVAVKTARFALLHPSTVRWGLLHALYLAFGIDPVAALTDAELDRLSRELSAARRGLDRDLRA